MATNNSSRNTNHHEKKIENEKHKKKVNALIVKLAKNIRKEQNLRKDHQTGPSWAYCLVNSEEIR
jgi:hypothetical protein